MRIPPSFAADSAITKLDDKTYSATLTKAFCVGRVPNGGFVASIFQKVASDYLSWRRQPDTIAAQWQFLNKTHEGIAVLVVEETKLGRSMSVLHVTLYQDDLLDESPWISPSSRKAVVAYITNGAITAEQGVNLPTEFSINQPPPPVDLERLSHGQDLHWARMFSPLMKVVPMLGNFDFHLPRSGHPLPTTLDLWIRLANGERFTNAALGYVADAGPPLIVEQFRPEDPTAPIPKGGYAFNHVFWYPTVSMSLDVKKKLPEEGEEWLRLRVVAKLIKNGRFDSEVIIFDKVGDIVALSNHVALAVDGKRNYGRKEKI